MEPFPVNLSPGPEYGPEARKFQGIASLERAPAGRLWAVWYAGPITEDCYNYVVGVTSGDDGHTWSDLRFVLDPDGDGPLRAFDPCPWLDPDGRLWVFWAVGGAGDPVLMAMTTSNPDDANPAWSTPRVLCPGIMMCKPVVTRDGAWLLPTAIWHREGSCRVVASTDRGQTWELRGTATVPDPKDRNCDEPMLVERRDGSLWLLVRTRYGIGEAVSTDGGRTWSAVQPSKIPHPAARFFIRRLRSGNLLLVKHGPLDRQTGRSLLTAFLSEDDGQTWKGGLLLDERSGVSYPDGAESADGVVYIAYDWNRVDDKHILMATFTERDILAGKAVSAAARLRVLINRATGINPKPWLKQPPPFTPADHADGAAVLTGPRAVLEAPGAEVREAAPGVPIFSNRAYTFAVLPAPLQGRRFAFAPIDGTRVVCRQAGAVFVLTPLPMRNADSVAPDLEKQGFERARLPEFILFLNSNGQASPANACTVYQKTMQPGEELVLGKWGVALF